MKRLSLVLGVGLIFVSSAYAETVVETFDGPPIGYWTAFVPYETWETEGGNPGGYLRLDWGAQETSHAMFMTHPSFQSVFTGDYRARMVSSIGIDLDTIHASFPNLAGRPVTLMLYCNNGTPGGCDADDDDYAVYVKGPNIPFELQGWLKYDFDIPYDSPVLPDGWTLWKNIAAPPDADWNDVITNVDQVIFWLADPDKFYLFYYWAFGVDNARVTWGTESEMGACCVDGACVASTANGDCDQLGGEWYANETCVGDAFACPIPCPEDFDGDGYIGLGDLAILLSNYNQSGPGDLNADGLVDLADLAMFLPMYDQPCPTE